MRYTKVATRKKGKILLEDYSDDVLLSPRYYEIEYKDDTFRLYFKGGYYEDWSNYMKSLACAMFLEYFDLPPDKKPIQRMKKIMWYKQ